jgi:uncharacterized phage-associated protein
MRASVFIGPPRFDEKKSTQAAAYFLRLAKGKMNYMLLIKLLYLLDRRALLKWGRPVTGDSYFSMKLGPVLSEVLSLVSEKPDPDNPGYWAEHISAPRTYDIKLLSDPGDGALSESEESLINAVFEKYGHYDRFRLATHLHKILPEWKAVQSGRVPITHADILKAGGRSPRDIEAIEKDLKEVSLVRARFSSPRAKVLSRT